MEGVGPECPRRVLVFSWWICGELLAFDRVLVTVVTSTSEDVRTGKAERSLFRLYQEAQRNLGGGGAGEDLADTINSPLGYCLRS